MSHDLLSALALSMMSAAPAPELAAWTRRAQGITIVRDDWGIAHVTGRTDADAVFGMMYAQAEDDFPRIERNYLAALGRLSEVEGDRALWHDVRARLFIDPSDLMARFRAAPRWLKALMEAWADGLNFYLATHPAVRPAALTRFEPWMALSFTEGSIGADIETISLPALRELYGSDKDKGAAAPAWAPVDRTGVGSNGIALAPARSRSGKALLLINPHTTFYFRSEQHVRSQEGLDAYGAATWGQFFIYQGFNRRCGWMHTSSGVDVIDEYRETFVEKNGRVLYRYGTEERPVGTRTFTLKVKSPAGALEERTFTTRFTHHGPVVRTEAGAPIAVALMFKPVEALSQSYLRTKASGLKEFLAAAAAHQANSSNATIFADADGHIAYLHPQFVPRRDDRFDFTRPVDGADPATDWKGLHSLDELPRAIDPPVGHVVNTNDWPYSAAGPDSPRKDAFPRYMDTHGPNVRGAHAALLLERPTFTAASLVEAAFDPFLPAFAQLVPQLIAAFDALGGADPLRQRLAPAVTELRRWDHRWATSSVATTLAVLWGEELQAGLAADSGGPRGMPQIDRLAAVPAPRRLEALATVLERLERDFGTINVPWGELNRLQREQPFDDGKPSEPVAFTSGRWGSLAAFEAGPGPGTKRRYGTKGNSFVAVVELSAPVAAVAVTVGGSSGDPSSPHHRDQNERFRTGALRRVYLSDEDLAAHTAWKGHPGQPVQPAAP